MSTSLAPSDFEFIAKLVKEESGISLEPGKEYLVTSRVEPIAKSLGYADVAALVGHLRSAGDATGRRQVVESLTTHETSFFRDQEPFISLQREIIPDLIEKLRPTRKMMIWCGAASSGQESYSLCMLLREHFPELMDWKITFVSTDISRPILDRCKTGVYNQIEVNRGLPIRMLAKYFDKDGSNWVIKPEIRSMVKFSEMNLLRPFVGLAMCDLVLMRNVLIYFDIATKREILEKTARVMAPHGYLLLGTAETTLNITDVFERVVYGKTICYRPKQTAGA
jgi:chemotaxis protein methyltransferase CheR